MKETISTIIEAAEHSALATSGPYGVNVVPISVFEFVDGEVRICHFFMNKTIENIRSSSEVSFTCWSGFEGVQVKGSAVIEESGGVFEEYVKKIRVRFPERTLLAVVRIVPTHIHDVAPGQNGREIT